MEPSSIGTGLHETLGRPQAPLGPTRPFFPRGGHSPVVCGPEDVGVWFVKDSLARQVSSVRQRAAGTVVGLGGTPVNLSQY